MSNTFNSTIKNLHDLSIQNLKSTLNNIVTQFSCPICQDVPTQPYLLPTCGHTFCYDCIKNWFPCNPSCPVCRAVIGETKPILNHSLKSIIDATLENLIALADPKLVITLKEWEINRNKDFNIDKASDFPWLKKIAANWARAVVDNEDGVPRCSACHWELIDGHCENCGRTMVGWQDRIDGDEIDDDEDDEEDENLFRQQSASAALAAAALSSDYDDNDDDIDDYDNGLHDMRNRFVHREAEDDDEDDEDDDDDDDDDDDGIAIDGEDYDSDDGFVVEDDDMSRIDDSDDDSDDQQDVDSMHALESGDEDIIHSAKKSTGSSNPIFTDSESSQQDVIDLSDIDSDEDLINTNGNRAKRKFKKSRKSNTTSVINLPSTDDDDTTPAPVTIDLDNNDSDDEIFKTFRSSKKPLLQDEDDEEDENQEHPTTISKPKKKHKHKHKHKHNHKKSKH